MRGMTIESAIRTNEKLEFLRLPSSYADEPEQVEVIETHFAWVFLSRLYAYKLNKPIAFHDVDYSSGAKRKHAANRALRLNRRLAQSVYIDVVPLVEHGSRLRLEFDGEPLDWLLKMRRLPADLMLESRLLSSDLSKADLNAIVVKLVAFYRQTALAPWDGSQYVTALRRSILRFGDDLSALPGEIDVAAADKLVAAQLGFIERNVASLEGRAEQAHIVDAHGDLRPEHICLDDETNIIDCIEFSDALRLLDSAEEISFLALECTRLGRSDIGAEVIKLYEAESGDFVRDDLRDFYSSRQALNRAVLSAWHLEDPFFAATQTQWIERTHWYLQAGQSSIESALNLAKK